VNARKNLIAALLFIAPVAAGAHEVWIERDGNGPARIYLGGPGIPHKRWTSLKGSGQCRSGRCAHTSYPIRPRRAQDREWLPMSKSLGVASNVRDIDGCWSVHHFNVSRLRPRLRCRSGMPTVVRRRTTPRQREARLDPAQAHLRKGSDRSRQRPTPVSVELTSHHALGDATDSEQTTLYFTQKEFFHYLTHT
jgi:hypothetical protein